MIRIMGDAFDEAAMLAGGLCEQRFIIGGRVIRLRFAGDALMPGVTRALAHLRADIDAQPELTISIWDSASTGRPLPFLAASLVRLLRITWLEDRGIRGEILDLNDIDLRGALEGYDTDILNLLDLEQNLGILWTPDWRTFPWYESGAPLRTLLSWWCESAGLHVLHGGAVGLPTGGLLLGGRGGSGKSTAALACLGSDLRYVGDDYCLVENRAEAQPYVHSLYNTAKVKGKDDFARFPWLADRVINPDKLEADGQKPMAFLHEHHAAELIPGFPLKAIVLPRYIPELAEPKIVPVSSASALKVLAESTILQLTGSGSAALQAMSGLTRQLPCYLLGVTADTSLIAPALHDILKQHL
ncbi:MAG: hypothetical protein J5I90_08420 [Caldilineales bacterium]|nr:hypothetical protein [Caldilineales bacterium]